MLKEVRYGDINFHVYKADTEKYYQSYNHLCDCPICRNYYQSIKSYSSKLNGFLDQFGIDIEKPIEIAYFEANKINHTVEYVAYYSVNGSVDVGEGDFYFGDIRIAVQKPETTLDTEVTEPYFILEISNLHMPWCITDDIDAVFPDKPVRTNYLNKIKNCCILNKAY